MKRAARGDAETRSWNGKIPPGNYGAPVPAAPDLPAEMAAFDALPRALRAAIREAPFKASAFKVRYTLDRGRRQKEIIADLRRLQATATLLHRAEMAALARGRAQLAVSSRSERQ